MSLSGKTLKVKLTKGKRQMSSRHKQVANHIQRWGEGLTQFCAIVMWSM